MKLIFLHIPKAGGTTLHSILERLYAGKVIFSIKVRGHTLGVEEFTNLAPAEKNAIHVLKGHMPFGLHTHFEGEESKYITLFRNPVDRIVSHYEYVLRKPNHYLYEKVISSKMSLLEYALSDLSAELDNHQCRSLIQDQNIPLNTFTEEHFDQAVKNLQNHFISFGIVEDFDRSLLLFRHDLGWNQYPYYVKLNTKPDYMSKKNPSEVLAQIAKRNYWDVRLYNWAKAELNKRLSTISNLDQELKTLQISSEAFGQGINHHAKSLKAGGTKKGKGIASFVKRLIGR